MKLTDDEKELIEAISSFKRLRGTTIEFEYQFMIMNLLEKLMSD